MGALCLCVISKMQDPQFAGQTKERLSSRQTSACCAVKMHLVYG